MAVKNRSGKNPVTPVIFVELNRLQRYHDDHLFQTVHDNLYENGSTLFLLFVMIQD